MAGNLAFKFSYQSEGDAYVSELLASLKGGSAQCQSTKITCQYFISLTKDAAPQSPYLLCDTP